jgi:spore coat polysaccharide biosynthesis protein SpsF
MEAGLLNKKVLFIIQARMNSTRFKGKVLRPIPIENGKTTLKWIVDILKDTKLEHKIIVATSKAKENLKICNYCNHHQIDFYQGSENDVLSRFIEVSKKFKEYNCIVRLTADNPILDLKILEKVIFFHLINGNDYSYTEDLPLGMNFEIISRKALLSLEKKKLTKSDKEHVTPFFKKNSRCKKGKYIPELSFELKKLRLTIDYPLDFIVLSVILSMGISLQLGGVELIEEVYKKNKWVLNVNEGLVQK